VEPWSDDRVWDAIHAERRRLAADLSDLNAEAWSTPSLCGDWTVEQVLAHLTAGAHIGRWRWLRSVIGARFDFALHNNRRLAEHLGRTPQQTLDNFVDAIELRIRPSRPTWAWLGEIIVHGEDIRRPLKINSQPDRQTVAYLASCFAGKSFTVPSHKIADGVRLVAADSDFRHGEGPEVTGRTIDLVMAMAARPTAAETLTGDGAPIIAGRIAP
jgi:uncharacterized protein (TIGR03083 family)